MKRSFLFICIFLALGCSISLAQTEATENETSISIQIRPRAEYRNGTLFPREEGQLPASFINNRARISLDYKRDNMIIRTSAQHVGVWGQDPQIDKNGRFILNEAWARLNFNNNFFAQLGRQGLVYDDERILGGLDWNVAGRFHDALKLGYENKSNKLHLILAFNQNDEKAIGGTYYASGAQPYKSMQTLWYNFNNSENPLSLSLLAMNLGQEGGNEEKADTRYLQTWGTNIVYLSAQWKLQGSFYYQTGKTVGNLSVSAWMASLQATYKISNQWRASVGSDYLSGNKEGESKYKAFNPLYGTHHKFYGSMDYFYASGFKGGLNPGLWDNYGSVNFKPSADVNITASYHNFRIASDVTVDNKEISKGLGSEIDLQVDWNVMKDVKLSAGYSMMFGTKSMDIVKGGNHNRWQDWGWVSLNINPRILNVKW